MGMSSNGYSAEILNTGLRADAYFDQYGEIS